MTVRYKKLHPDARPPFRATEGSAGADLFALICGGRKSLLIQPKKTIKLQTGIAVEIPQGYGGFLFPRSSLAANHGVSLANCVGVIDSDYRGEIIVPLINHSDSAVKITNGDRIAQLVIMPIATAEFIDCDESATCSDLSDTARGDGGFGSTGK